MTTMHEQLGSGSGAGVGPVPGEQVNSRAEADHILLTPGQQAYLNIDPRAHDGKGPAEMDYWHNPAVEPDPNSKEGIALAQSRKAAADAGLADFHDRLAEQDRRNRPIGERARDRWDQLSPRTKAALSGAAEAGIREMSSGGGRPGETWKWKTARVARAAIVGGYRTATTTENPEQAESGSDA